MKRIGWALIVLQWLASSAIAAHHSDRGPAAARAYRSTPIAASEIGAWRADLDQLVAELERLHPNPYSKLDATQFRSAVEAIRNEIPGLAAHEIVVRFARLLARVGDGHTSLPLYFAEGVDFHVLPVRLGFFAEGVFIEAADARYRELVGGRVERIGEVPIDTVVDRVRPLISRDNDHWIAAVAPHLINRIEVLHALGIAPDLTGVSWSVRVDGEPAERVVVPLDQLIDTGHGLPFMPEYTRDWVDARDGSDRPIPLYQQRPEAVHWWVYRAESDLLYVKWDQVANRSRQHTALETFAEAMAFARENPPARTVIDLRNNSGGEGGLLPPIVREIVRTREVDAPGKLYVVIGRRTFSAAQMFTGMLESYSTAILVGEPSSAAYNGYAGHAFSRLPHSGVVFAVSPDYYQMGPYPRDRRQRATPKLAAIPSFEDYRANRDAALEAVLSHQEGRFQHAILEAVEAGRPERARDLVAAYDRDPVHQFRPAAGRLNAFAYQALSSDPERALRILQWNVRIHPGYANGWDSLGEVLESLHRPGEAIAAFKKALEIDPHLQTSRNGLHRLGAQPPGD